jgi:hypothetical protein
MDSKYLKSWTILLLNTQSSTARSYWSATFASEGPGDELPDSTFGYVLQNFTVAIAALRDPRSLEDVLVDVTKTGGDTDTNGVISGGLLGARDDIEPICK